MDHDLANEVRWHAEWLLTLVAFGSPKWKIEEASAAFDMLVQALDWQEFDRVNTQGVTL